MNTFLWFLILMLPVGALAYTYFRIIKKKGERLAPKKSLKANLMVFALAFVLMIALTLTVLAQENNDPGSDNNTEATEESTGSDKGLGLLSAALVTGLAGIGGGIAVAAGAPAAIAATSEDPTVFGKALIFVALGETIALYGVVISILILNKI